MAPFEEETEDDHPTEVQIEEELEEVEPIKKSIDPGRPTAAQIEDHRVDHLPYRCWCKWCVLGRGRGIPHRRKSDPKIAIIGLDYFFIIGSEVKSRDELKEFEDSPEGKQRLDEARGRGGVVKCIVIRCAKTKAIMAHVIPCKGVDEEGYVANMVVSDIRWLGYSQMILKGDNEKAMQALIDLIVRKLKAGFEKGERVTKEEPPRYESKSNGGTEI
ncbi:MAG: hypothetical protein QF541_25255, partial [Lentisphaeria bacterium]|nr:hypothetical protein [Lentisphaeria bacterium]